MEYKEEFAYNVDSLMEQFPSFSYWDIYKLAYSLGIKEIYNAQSILSAEKYSALDDKMRKESRSRLSRQLEIETKEEVKEEVKREGIVLKDIKRQKHLSETFLFEAINILKIKDINGNNITDTQDIEEVYISEFNSEILAKKAQELNSIHAQKNNPLCNNKKPITETEVIKKNSDEYKNNEIFPDNMTVQELSDKYNISIPELMKIGKKLGIKYMYNKTSYLKKYFYMQIIKEIEINTKDKVYDIDSMMEEYPSLPYENIVKIAYELGIKNIENEYSLLSKEEYTTLKNKLLEESQDLEKEIESYKNYSSDDSFTYSTEDSEENILPDMDTLSTSEDDDATSVLKDIDTDVVLEENEAIDSLKTLQRTKGLNKDFIFESIKMLDIKDRDGNSISDEEDMESIYVDEEHWDKIVEQTNTLNAINANKNNPLIQKKIIASQSLKSVQRDNHLNENFMFEAITTLEIKDKDENIIASVDAMKDSYVSEENAKKVIEKTNALNTVHAKEHNPAMRSEPEEVVLEEFKPLLTNNRMTMDALSEKHDINVYTLIKVAKDLEVPHILYPSSHATLYFCNKIIEKINKTSDAKNTTKPYNTMTMEELSKKHDIHVSLLINAGKELGLTCIRYPNSYTDQYNCKQIIEKTQKKKSGLKILKKSSSMGIFETLLEEDTLIFIDTSSLMNRGMPPIIENEIIPALLKHEKVVFIVDSVIHEVSVKLNQTNNTEYQEKAEIAKDILAQLAKQDLYQIPETHSVNKHFADAELLTVFSDLRLKYNLCLITNDNSSFKDGGLSNSILELQTSSCISTESIKEISVLYVGNEGLVQYLQNRCKEFTLHENAPIRVTL